MMLWLIWLSSTRLLNWLISRTSALCMGHQLLNLYCSNVVFLEPQCVQNSRFSDAAGALIDRVGLCEPATVFFLTCTHIYSSFHVAFHVWAKILGWSWTSPSCSFSIPKQSPRPSDSEHNSDLVSSSTSAHSPSSDHQHLTDFLLWIGILSLVLQFATEEIFLPSNSEQITSAKTPCVSPCSWNDIHISYHGTEDTSWSAFAHLSHFVSCSVLS